MLAYYKNRCYIYRKKQTKDQKMKTAKANYKRSNELRIEAKKADAAKLYHTGMMLRKQAQEHFDKATIIEQTNN